MSGVRSPFDEVFTVVEFASELVPFGQFEVDVEAESLRITWLFDANSLIDGNFIFSELDWGPGGGEIVNIAIDPSSDWDSVGNITFDATSVTIGIGGGPVSNGDTLIINLVTSDADKCVGDFNDDGVVAINDLLFLLAAWGPCSDCEGEVCGAYSFSCDPNNSGCTCFTLFDGSGFCGTSVSCDQLTCPDGNCPPGFVCQVETCCGENICVDAATQCNVAAAPSFEFGQLTSAGIAGVDFHMSDNPTKSNDNPDCPGDLNFDGVVGINDLLIFLGAWGPCPATCGDPKAGNCFVDNDTPFCNDEVCCATVCAIDPFCCDTSWDSICAAEANDLCEGCGSELSGNCFINKDTAFCDDKQCCTTVCAIDPFCCEVRWDGICVDEAVTLCLGLEPCDVGAACPAELCGTNNKSPANCFCFEVADEGDTYCINNFSCGNPECAADLSCPPGFVCVTDSCCGAPTCAPAINTCQDLGSCDDPFVCGGDIVNCDDPDGQCFCWTGFDGSGICALNTASCLDLTECPGGDCPPGFVCVVQSCCTVNVCLAECGLSLTTPELEFGELTPLGVAGIDFEIINTQTQAPKPLPSGMTGAGIWID